jgi:hypothetical protein
VADETKAVWHAIDALRQAWPQLTAVAAVVAAGFGYLDNRFTAQAAATAEIQVTLKTQARELQEREKSYTERLCTDEYEMIESIADYVQWTAADADPNKKTRLATGVAARKRFLDASERWPCPSNDDELRDRVRRPLWKRADAAR